MAAQTYRGYGLPYGNYGLPTDEAFDAVSKVIEEMPEGQLFNSDDIIKLARVEEGVHTGENITRILWGYEMSDWYREDGCHLRVPEGDRKFTGFLWQKGRHPYRREGNFSLVSK